MTRPHLADPTTIEEWEALPIEFTEYLDQIEAARADLAKKEPIESYDYTWEVDDEIPFKTILQYWNDTGELTDPIEVVEGIQEGLCEQAMIAWEQNYFSP